MASLKKRLIAATVAGISAVAAVAPASLADDYSYVTAEHLNVRTVGSVKGKIVATVDKGYRVTVLDGSGRWKRVLLENGQEGYVNGGYLSDSAPYYEKVSSTRYGVKVAKAFVRSDGLLRKIAVLNGGDQLEAVSDRVYFGKWIRVRIVSSANSGYEGRVGYIHKALVNPVEGFQIMDEAPAAAEQVQEAETPAEEAAPAATEDAPAEEVPTNLESAPATDSGSDEEDLSKLLEGL